MAELRSSVIRINSKNASSVRRRGERRRKTKSGLLDGGGEQGTYIEPRTGRHKGQSALNLKGQD